VVLAVAVVVAVVVLLVQTLGLAELGSPVLKPHLESQIKILGTDEPVALVG
jgi:hypothetical protein